MILAGVILAGGASRRMGTPKPLLEFGGQTFLDRLIGVLFEECATVIVVLGHEAETIRAGLRRADQARFTINPDPEKGQFSSLQCGLRAVPANCDAVIFTPADYPAVQASTVARLAEALRGERMRPLVAIPTFQGRRGHPVGAARELIAEFLDLPPNSQARHVIHRHADRTAWVEVDDPGVVEDIDDPDAYRRLLARSFAS